MVDNLDGIKAFVYIVHNNGKIQKFIIKTYEVWYESLTYFVFVGLTY
jgi:hypothetical protein